MLTLYFTKDTCALASHIALRDAGAEFELTSIDFQTAEQTKPEFLAVNPKGRVPALATAHGVLTETPAILAYIAQAFPSAALAPLDDAYAFATLQSLNSYICSTLHVAHAHRMRGYRWVDADDAHSIAAMQSKVPENVGAAFRYIEDECFVGPYVLGEQYTISDPYLFTLARWMENDGLNAECFPKVAAHRNLMLERQSVQDSLYAEHS